MVKNISFVENGSLLKQTENMVSNKLPKCTVKKSKPTKLGGVGFMSDESEIEIAFGLNLLKRCGYKLTREQIKKYVRSYVKYHILEDGPIGDYLRKYNRFKDYAPGDDWTLSFVRRYDISTELPQTIPRLNRIAHQNPKIVYGFFKLLQDLISELDLGEKPECIWNVDQTVLNVEFYDSDGEPINESICVMAAASAHGDKIAPHVVFQDHLLDWVLVNNRPGMDLETSECGTVTPDIFLSWFKKFCTTVTERPLLLIYDGPTFHISYEVVALSIIERISIIKPPTSKDLQPLNMCCFEPLRLSWTDARDSIHISNEITRFKLLNIIGNLWDMELERLPISASFITTGLFPADPDKYPLSNFDKNLYKNYLEDFENMTNEFEAEPEQPSELMFPLGNKGNETEYVLNPILEPKIEMCDSSSSQDVDTSHDNSILNSTNKSCSSDEEDNAEKIKSLAKDNKLLELIPKLVAGETDLTEGEMLRKYIHTIDTEQEGQKYLVPFRMGWTREVVFRSRLKVSFFKGKTHDVYYRSPDNVKFRTRTTLNEYLITRKITKLTDQNFAFRGILSGVSCEFQSIRDSITTLKTPTPVKIPLESKSQSNNSSPLKANNRSVTQDNDNEDEYPPELNFSMPQKFSSIPSVPTSPKKSKPVIKTEKSDKSDSSDYKLKIKFKKSPGNSSQGFTWTSELTSTPIPAKKSKTPEKRKSFQDPTFSRCTTCKCMHQIYCGDCDNCLDLVKFGGRGTKRKPCMIRSTFCDEYLRQVTSIPNGEERDSEASDSSQRSSSSSKKRRIVNLGPSKRLKVEEPKQLEMESSESEEEVIDENSEEVDTTILSPAQAHQVYMNLMKTGQNPDDDEDKRLFLCPFCRFKSRKKNIHAHLRKKNSCFSNARFQRCNSCPGCLSKDCRQCTSCLDKKVYGGPGIKKKPCMNRKCSNENRLKPEVLAAMELDELEQYLEEVKEETNDRDFQPTDASEMFEVTPEIHTDVGQYVWDPSLQTFTTVQNEEEGPELKVEPESETNNDS